MQYSARSVPIYLTDGQGMILLYPKKFQIDLNFRVSTL